jgi:CubicO group peptidase (beta-lactamase class C family)
MAIVHLAIPLFSQDKATEIDNLINTYNEYGQFNGAVLVAESGNVIFKKGYGLANMEWNIPNETDTKFRIASITKQFTAMIVMILQEEGKLNV